MKNIILILFSLYFLNTSAQVDSSQSQNKYNSKRLLFLTGTCVVGYGVSMYLLNDLWYKDYPKSSFHFFNDNNEWLQVDKLGHFYTAYYIGTYGIKLFNWTGLERKKAIWLGGLIGTVYMTNIEILDGFSQHWGFSLGDMTVNILGSFAVISQQLAWNEQKIIGKWSFHQTKYSKYRPDLLGKNMQENWLKDYNGQTYWVSCNIYSFLNKNSKFPKWLNVSFGYGAEGMLGATSNPYDYKGSILPIYERYHQYYISLDLDLSRIKTKSKFVNTIFQALNLLKFPAPAIEFNRIDKVKLHGVYF
ncbi:MAG: DUF2279 domain-containing protein [Bacteroidales bacterium]|jgi:hypothetical protein